MAGMLEINRNYFSTTLQNVLSPFSKSLSYYGSLKIVLVVWRSGDVKIIPHPGMLRLSKRASPAVLPFPPTTLSTHISKKFHLFRLLFTQLPWGTYRVTYTGIWNHPVTSHTGDHNFQKFQICPNWESKPICFTPIFRYGGILFFL